MEKSADRKRNNFGKMAPKNIDDPVDSNSTTNADDSDLQEVVAVNESLDELTQALDFFEQRTDDIIAQLKVLLDSNREIRKQIAQDKEKEMIDQLAAASMQSSVCSHKVEDSNAQDEANTATTANYLME